MIAERRRHIRVPGPFTAFRTDTPDVPVRVVDWSEGGCFIETPSDAPSPDGAVELRITLPDGESTVVTGTVVYVDRGGYAVLFGGMSGAAYAQLERTIARLRALTL